MKEKALPANEVRDLLDYDPISGVFTWKMRSDGPARWNAEWVGRQAGSVNHDGYISIGIRNRRYQAHRLAWAWMIGTWPDRDIDHVDGNRSNNQWQNLRKATKSQNSQNTKIPKTNTTGVKGVCYDKNTGKWQSQIRCNGKRMYLGQFASISQAQAAYEMAARRLHGEYRRTR